jgi:hypothetical protein
LPAIAGIAARLRQRRCLRRDWHRTAYDDRVSISRISFSAPDIAVDAKPEQSRQRSDSYLQMTRYLAWVHGYLAHAFG